MKYRLILVPEECIRTCSPRNAIPEYVTVSPGVLYEKIADIEDHKIIMSREMYDQLEVVDPVAPPFPGEEDVVV